MNVNENEVKEKKPFYKKAWFIILVIIIALIIFNNISNSIKENNKGGEVKLNTTQLGEYLPELPTLKGKINSDSDKYLSIELYKASPDDFESLMEKCKEKGFINESNRTSSMYSAKNEDGTSLKLYYSENSKKLSITLDKYSNDSINNTTNVENNNLSNNNINTTNIIDSANDSKNVEETKTQENTTKSNSSQGLSNEFKEFMDSYEEYMNEYIEFMKKYNANSSDINLLSQYATMLKKYSEWEEKFDKYDDEHELNNEELSYYLDVQTRINKKLLEINN